MPLWIEALTLRHYDVKVVIPIRHPLEVTASLSRRDGFGLEKSICLWLRYMIDSIIYGAEVKCGIVVFDELIKDWRSSMQRLCQELQINLYTDEAPAVYAIEEHLDKNLRNHNIQNNSDIETYSGIKNVLINLSLQLYESLLNRSPDVITLANDIQHQLAVIEMSSDEFGLLKQSEISIPQPISKIFTADADLHLLADGIRINHYELKANSYSFTIPAGTNVLWLKSRFAVPEALETSPDDRQLGFCVFRMVAKPKDASYKITIEPHHTELTEGFYQVEDMVRRWTNGSALLPNIILGNGKEDMILTITGKSLSRYLIFESATDISVSHPCIGNEIF